jgi:hypothetical protein
MDDVRDRREKVLSKIRFWENVTLGLAGSVASGVMVAEYFALDALDPYIVFGFALISFLCGLIIIKCVEKCVELIKRRKLSSYGALVYEHSIRREKKFSISQVLYGVLLFSFYTFIQFWEFRRLPHSIQDSCPIVTCSVLIGVFWFLLSCRLCTQGVVLKIAIILYVQELKLSFSDAIFVDKHAAFTIGEIADARIVTADDPDMRQHVINEQWGSFKILRNIKTYDGPYMYALFLSKSFPLPDGHQAVDLKLRNGRHVLIETDDADNFLAALKRCGVGG